MIKHPVLAPTLILLALSVYLGSWLLMGHWLYAYSTGGTVMWLLCYWLGFLVVTAVFGALSWIVTVVVYFFLERPDRQKETP